MVRVWIGRKRFEAADFDDLVRAMKLDQWMPPKTPNEYMTQVAKRSVVWCGEDISFSNAREFIRELRRIGAITKLEED
jgi:hypothetical protein